MLLLDLPLILVQTIRWSCNGEVRQLQGDILQAVLSIIPGISELPARVLYEDVFPSVVAEHCDPPIPYHRGSPYGGKGWDTADPTIGDVHQWDIWGGKEWPWQEYPFHGGRFVR